MKRTLSCSKPHAGEEFQPCLGAPSVLPPKTFSLTRFLLGKAGTPKSGPSLMLCPVAKPPGLVVPTPSPAPIRNVELLGADAPKLPEMFLLFSLGLGSSHF